MLQELLEKEQELRKRNQILSQNCANVTRNYLLQIVSKVEKDVASSTETLNKPINLKQVSTAAENEDGYEYFSYYSPGVQEKLEILPSEWNTKKDKNGVEAVNKLLKTKIFKSGAIILYYQRKDS